MDFDSLWGFKRLCLAFRTLLRGVCQRYAVVLVLEDLQWADQESIQLLRTLLTDKQRTQLLFVGTVQSATKAIGNLKLELSREDAPGAMQTIQIGDLSVEEVSDWVSKLLQQDRVMIDALAALVHRNTGGNVFFVAQFLRLLQEQLLVVYSLATYRREWDLDRIATKTHVADNVLGVLSHKISVLPNELQAALTSAAFLGPSRFDAEILLQTISSHERSDDQDEKESHNESKYCVDIEGLGALEKMLSLGVNEGLLEKLGAPRMYKFAHDRIKETVAALVPTDETRIRLHLHIGRQVYQLSVDDVLAGCEEPFEDRLLLLAVHHLNLGSQLMYEKEQKSELARLNYRAAIVAFRMSSFFAAAEFLEAGLGLLDKDSRWDEYYEATLELATALAHVQSCCGKPYVAATMVDEILEHAKCLKDKLGAYRSSIRSLFQQGDYDMAIQTNLLVLDQLGLRIPRRFLKLHVLRLVLRVRFAATPTKTCWRFPK
jgi:predicted ATPase